MKFLLIGIGGALGALSRSYLSEAIEKVNFLPLPMGFLLVNFLGCFFLGLLINSLDVKYQEIYQPLLFIGFLGAFTTFSAFSREALDLLNQGQVLFAVAYVVLTVTLCLLGTWLGVLLTNK
jgi:CrcB protein|tara:strand:+ start:2379 stop:2741 length:363 start_codon:yes stop_codon:yes gene_type:complete